MSFQGTSIPGAAALVLALVGCGGGGGGTTADAGGGMDAGPPPAPDTGLPDSGPPPVDTGMPMPDAGMPDAGPPPDMVRFVAMGDTGEGNEAQRDVAIQIRDKCAADGCDFVILLGDNIYDSGVDSVDDPQWRTKFEDPYTDIDLPFYVVLGNHDYGGSLFGFDQGGLGNEFDLGPIEVAYTDHSDKWTMPATHYTFTWGNVGFIMLDTNSILWDDTTNGDQRMWFPMAMMEVSGKDWVFAFGHHTLRSNGPHGNAGSYESIEVGGIEIPNPLPILNGNNVASFFDDVVCGNVDVYFSGHDHNRQWVDDPDALCGAEIIVSGAGAKTSEVRDRGNTTFFEDASTEGFMYVVVDGDMMTGQFINRDGTVDYERTIMRR